MACVGEGLAVDDDQVGILDRSHILNAEIDVYWMLALGDDHGAAYLRIMAALGEQSKTPVDYRSILDDSTVPYPVQNIWGADDPILRLRRFG